MGSTRIFILAKLGLRARGPRAKQCPALFCRTYLALQL
jgi:hypothetical protein